MEDNNLQDELASFRREWKEELKNAAGRQSPSVPTESKAKAQLDNITQERASVKTSESKTLQAGSTLNKDDNAGNVEDCIDIKEKAEIFFRKGISLERDGLPYEALRFYRKAIQLVPDIESKITDFSNPSSDDEDYDEYLIKDPGINIPGIATLVKDVHNLTPTGVSLCEKEYESRMTHISDIPVELLMYIFKWVVSSSLDFKSLEQVSMYFEEPIMQLSKYKTTVEHYKRGMWGVNCDAAITKWGGSWRSMFINRPHLWTQGIYISKTTYMRPSEKVEDVWSLQLVTYYRYIRFFNDGAVHVLTTPDEPQVIVPRFSQPGLSVKQGHYKILGNKVVLVLDVDSPIDSYNRGRKPKRSNHSKLLENIFRMELEIRSTSRRRLHNQLAWVRYSHCKTYRDTGQTVVSAIDITSQFPPLWFSPIRSYTQIAVAPLK